MPRKGLLAALADILSLHAASGVAYITKKLNPLGQRPRGKRRVGLRKGSLPDLTDILPLHAAIGVAYISKKLNPLGLKAPGEKEGGKLSGSCGAS